MQQKRENALVAREKEQRGRAGERTQLLERGIILDAGEGGEQGLGLAGVDHHGEGEVADLGDHADEDRLDPAVARAVHIGVRGIVAAAEEGFGGEDPAGLLENCSGGSAIERVEPHIAEDLLADGREKNEIVQQALQHKGEEDEYAHADEKAADRGMEVFAAVYECRDHGGKREQHAHTHACHGERRNSCDAVHKIAPL